MRTPTFFGVLTLACLAGTACLDDSITGTRPLAVDLTIEPETVAVNTLMTATYTASGTGLYELAVAWGDGLADTLDISGSLVTISGPVDHTYTATGTFDVKASATDRTGTITATAVVTVN